MNNYNVNDESITEIDAYNKFLQENPGQGSLKIKASSANGAVPISNVKIVVSKIIGNNNFIFFEGITNESGIIEKIILPAALIDTNNLDIPKTTIYDIKATYHINKINLTYKVSMYDGIYVVQNININPNMNMIIGDRSGS